jgi:hypothetical protein
MPSNLFVYRATICLIWALALWHSWTCRGLFVDGSAFLVQIVRREWFFDFYAPRLYAMIVGQIPVMTAVTLGVTDLHLLGRLLSLGLFGLPTLFYTFALHRVKDEPVLMAIVIAAIAIVFMTTSFFIIGEYNTAYAICMMVAVRLATAKRLTYSDSIALVLAAALATRTYEVMIYLGPLMASMVLWRVWRVPARPIVPTLLHLAAVGFFIFSMFVAVDSVVHPHSAEHLVESWHQAFFFWQNLQFDFVFVAALIVVVWALLRPGDLNQLRPYRWALICLAILALSPLLALTDTLVRPLAKSQYVARMASGLVIAFMIIVIWAYKAKPGRTLPAFAAIAEPAAGRRLLAFAGLMLLAVIPSDLFLTATWSRYLDALATTVRNNTGVVAFEDTPLAKRPHNLLVENWVLTTQSLALRSKADDAVLAPPRGFDEWVPFPPREPPNIGQFFWRY